MIRQGIHSELLKRLNSSPSVNCWWAGRVSLWRNFFPNRRLTGSNEPMPVFDCYSTMDDLIKLVRTYRLTKDLPDVCLPARLIPMRLTFPDFYGLVLEWISLNP